MSCDPLTTLLLVSSAVRLWGEWAKGDRLRFGWLLSIGAALLGLLWSFETNALALTVTGVGTVLVAVRGWVRWGRVEEERRLEIHALRNRLAAAELALAASGAPPTTSS